VVQGTSSIWERWNAYTVEKGFAGNKRMNSFNHYTVPNTTATLYIPATSQDRVMESGNLAMEAERVTLIRHEDGRAIYELESGSYSFTVGGLL
jgi:hypothetical protein